MKSSDLWRLLDVPVRRERREYVRTRSFTLHSKQVRDDSFRNPEISPCSKITCGELKVHVLDPASVRSISEEPISFEGSVVCSRRLAVDPFRIRFAIRVQVIAVQDAEYDRAWAFRGSFAAASGHGKAGYSSELRKIRQPGISTLSSPNGETIDRSL